LSLNSSSGPPPRGSGAHERRAKSSRLWAPMSVAAAAISCAGSPARSTRLVVCLLTVIGGVKPGRGARAGSVGQGADGDRGRGARRRTRGAPGCVVSLTSARMSWPTWPTSSSTTCSAAVKSALDGWPSYNGAAEVLKRLHVQIQERLLGLDQRRLAERRARERRAHPNRCISKPTPTTPPSRNSGSLRWSVTWSGCGRCCSGLAVCASARG
jgi:hypothetical protein